MSSESNRSRGNRGGRGNRSRLQNSGRNHPLPQRSSQLVPPPRPDEIENEQRQALSNSFNSSELSYSGSDMIVFVPLGEEYKGAWRKLIKREFTNQHQMRRFITSCIVDTKKVGYELDALVEELGSSEGISRIRQIVMSPVSVDAGNQAKVASFQRVTLPFLALLIRKGIVDCILDREINAIYSVIYNNLDSFMNDVVMSMLEELVRRKNITDQRTNQSELLADDPNAFIPTSLGQFFLVIIRLINEFLKRIKSASFNETMHQIAERFERLKIEWQESLRQAITSDPLASNTDRRYYFLILDKEIDRMNNALGRKNRSLPPQKIRKVSSNQDIEHYRNLSRLADLQRTYDPPGELSPKGRRHDNDFSKISEISIIPTKEETLCEREPFLPNINEDDSMHHLPKGAARLLDRQFRLLREDMLNTFRSSVNGFISFLSETDKNDAQMQKFKTQGGRYKYQGDSGDLNVYTNVEFSEIVIDRRRGFSCQVAFTPPNTRKRTVRERKAYWEKAKRLMHGNLVCLLWPNEDINSNEKETISATEYSLYFGTVARRDEKMLTEKEESAKVDINFIDVSIYSIAMKDVLSKHALNRVVKHRFMVESTDLLFESYKNILKTLQEAQPEIFPFEKYLAPQIDGDISNMIADVDPPLYSRAPGFKFDLSVLLKDNENRELHFNVEHIQSRNDAIRDLKTNSTLDETQAQSLVTALSREVALIEGPPGTGKTYIGVQIMRVLLAEKNRQSSKMGPILTITYTNHALDSFLLSLIDHKITNIVRMGSRSKSDIIMEFQLDEICRNRKNKVSRPRGLGRALYELRQVEEEVEKITKSQTHRWINWKDHSVTSYLMVEFPEHYENLKKPNIPNALLNNETEGAEDSHGEWKSVDGNKSIIEQWVRGADLQTAQKSKEFLFNQAKKLNRKNKVKNQNRFFTLADYSDYDDDIPNFDDDIDYEFQNWLRFWEMPMSERSLEELKVDCDVWRMSRVERMALHDFWKEEIHSESIDELARIKKRYDQIRGEIDKIYSEERRDILSKSDVIGVTTSGAAKYHDLIRSIGPKIIICEEAGEVLEAHILSSLTPSVQHVILIGDHNQLRPKICTYKLSIDSDAGKNYGLDVSLFERLVHGKNSCMRVEATQLLTQRRMRSEIADLVRKTIYPELEDHPTTSLYPNVRGAQTNVFFINHRHPEDSMKSEFALQSHSNEFEVKMVVEMVKYFVRNGYSKSEQIAVLTPYLGQMLKIRDALSSSFVVVIDERDNDALVNFQERIDDNEQPKAENTIIASRKRLTQQVVLRTIDNYQGEEADIVIVSLVRNIMNRKDRGSIGFLKSRNRTNVLLSRARHGMYLIGNAELMENESKMWADVIKILRSRQPSQVNYGFPIVCAQHPDYKNIIFNPQQFEEVSPDGGCIQRCGRALNCGHICPYKCHSDDPSHVSVFCRNQCMRLHECGHPCERLCGEQCGECNFPVGNIMLPCGHTLANATCHQSRSREKILCETKVSKKLLKCEHEITVNCHESVDDVQCRKNCGSQLSECGHSCKSTCWECQRESIKANNDIPQFDENRHVKRTKHKRCKQTCSKNQFCGHICLEKCHIGKLCPGCKGVCNVSCVHSECKLRCSTPCSVCAERCNWSCEHEGECDLPCGVPCSRLPCNKHCKKLLECGHRCFGVCGEKCPSSKFCVKCAPENVKNQVVDLIMQSTFAEVNWNEELMVVLECDHVFTAETLDMMFEMNKFYRVDNQGNWIAIKPIIDQPGDLKCCPNCRKLIKNVRRYGRVIKKRILDTQNRKFLMAYDLRLKDASKSFEKITNYLEGNRKNLIEKLNGPLIHVDRAPGKEMLNRMLPEVTPRKHFEKLEHYYSIPRNHEELWNKHVAPLLASYTKISLLMSHTADPPYKLAYNAAVSSLFRKKSEVKMDELIGDIRLSETFSDNSPATQNRRLQESLEEVGITTPKIDRRIYLDAFLEIVNIQKALFHEASSIINELTSEYKESWLKFSKFLTGSTKSHLELINKTGLETKYTRHSVLALLELVEFKCIVGRFKLRNPPSGIVNPAIKRKIIGKCSKIEDQCSHIRGLLSSMDLDHFKRQCNERIDGVLQSVQELRISVERSGELTRDEKLQIHRAMNDEFNGSGHWYQCPNGHIYTIGECGGAMQLARCPDCGEAIGGGDHSLTQGNTRNMEFDAMQI